MACNNCEKYKRKIKKLKMILELNNPNDIGKFACTSDYNNVLHYFDINKYIEYKLSYINTNEDRLLFIQYMNKSFAINYIGMGTIINKLYEHNDINSLKLLIMLYKNSICTYLDIAKNTYNYDCKDIINILNQADEHFVQYYYDRNNPMECY